jgi:GNAT superfamily N-acetyltransferase
MKEELPIIVRDSVPSDINLVYNSWLKQHYGSAFSQGIPPHVYFTGHRVILNYLTKAAIIKVACSVEDASHIYGWMCAETHEVPLVHFVYVKQPYRRMGIATLLLEEYGWSKGGDIIASHYFRGKAFKVYGRQVVYNPYILHKIPMPGNLEERMNKEEKI